MQNVTIETSWRNGNTTCQINNGWSNLFEIHFKKKVRISKGRNSGQKSLVRRWMRETMKELQKRLRKEEVERFSRSCDMAAVTAMWSRYNASKSQFDFSKFLFEDLKLESIFNPLVFVWFYVSESIPTFYSHERKRQIHFHFGLYRLGGKIKNADDLLVMLKKKLSSLTKERKEFIEKFYPFMFNYVSEFRSSARIVEMGGENQRIDEDDGEAYSLSSFIEVYGEEDGKAKFEKSEIATHKNVRVWSSLLSIAGLDKLKPTSLDMSLTDMWNKFLTIRPKECDLNESVGRDEWKEVLRVMLELKPNFEGYDEYSSPSILSEFRVWALDLSKSKSNGIVESGNTEEDDNW